MTSAMVVFYDEHGEGFSISPRSFMTNAEKGFYKPARLRCSFWGRTRGKVSINSHGWLGVVLGWLGSGWARAGLGLAGQGGPTGLAGLAGLVGLAGRVGLAGPNLALGSLFRVSVAGLPTNRPANLLKSS